MAAERRRDQLVLTLVSAAAWACVVQREPPEAREKAAAKVAEPAATAPPSPDPDPDAALRAIVRPQAQQADAPPIGEPPAAVARQEPGVALIEAGQAPQQALRLHPKVGDEARLQLALQMSVAMQLGKQAIAPQAVPDVNAALDVKVVAADAKATRYELAVASVTLGESEGASARVQQAVQDAAEKLRAAKGEGSVGPRGVEHGLRLDLTDEGGLAPTFEGFREAYGHLFVALPEEPVGIGARWTVVTHGELSGLAIQRVATYTLRAREGDRLTLAVEVTEHAVEGGTAKPATGSVRATGYAAKGSGEVVADLAELAPISGSIASESTTHAEAALAGGTHTVLMQISVKAQLGR